MLIVKSYEHTSPHEQVVFVSLKSGMHRSHSALFMESLMNPGGFEEQTLTETIQIDLDKNINMGSVVNFIYPTIVEM